MQARVVRASSTGALEQKINNVLSHVGENFVDLKLSGAFDGKDKTFVAVILFR